MGYSNVSLVYTSWANLSDRPFRALTYMALMASDTDCPPLYFGGYPALARALGRNITDEWDPGSAKVREKRARKAAMEAVRIALVPLKDAGVVVVSVEEAPGRGPVLALLLDARMRRAFRRIALGTT